MNWFRQLKYKTRIGLLLVAIMGIILLNNISGRSNYADLDQSMTSLYKDRLMPATYIFRLSDHLYQKKLLHDQPAPGQPAQLQQHDAAMRNLIRDYEATRLTAEEQQQWLIFKQQLQQYDRAVTRGQTVLATQSFDRALKCLEALSTIQTGEGNQLRQSSSAIISATAVRSSFEIVLVILLGMVTVLLVGTSKEALLQRPHKPSLN